MSVSQKKRSSVPVIEAQPDLLAHLGQAAGVRVHGALRLAGGSRRVEDECARLGIERESLRGGRLSLQKIVPGGCAQHDGVTGERRHLRGQRDAFAAPLQKVGGEEHPCARILQACRDGARPEAGENRHHGEPRLEAAVEDGENLRDHRHADAPRGRRPPARAHAVRWPPDWPLRGLRAKVTERVAPFSPSQMQATRSLSAQRSRQLCAMFRRPPVNHCAHSTPRLASSTCW